jgi:hypothetical protein
MVDRLDVVAVRVQHKGAVVARVVFPLARRAVVGAARGQGRFVKGFDGGLVLGLESQVDVGWLSASWMAPALPSDCSTAR